VDDRDDDPSLRHGRPDHEWQRVVVRALCASPVLADRNARAMLVELVGDALGRPVHLREQATLPLQFLELVRFCAREDGGPPALVYAVATVAGDGWTSDTVREQVERIERIRKAENAAPAADVDVDADEPAEGLKDFFVTYGDDDRRRAQWIAALLEAAGYTVVMAFRTGQADPGAHAAWHKHRTRCARTIAVTGASIKVDHEPPVHLSGIPGNDARVRLLEAVAPPGAGER